MKTEQLTDVVTCHGEGPAYCERWAGPRWVDMMEGDILQLEPDGSVSRAHVGSVAAMIRPRRGGGFVVAGERGILLADDDALDAPLTALPEVFSTTAVRMNEGGCAPDGTLYLGSMAYDGHEGGAKLYRIGADHEPHVFLDAVTVSNGLGWSPDGTRAYYNDTRTRRIDVFDWTASDGLTDRRPFVSLGDGLRPDGLTVDAEGGVWTALFGASAVRRYDVDAELTAVVDLPASQVTAVTFVGEDLDRLVITTSRQNLADGAEPLAGALFGVADPGVRGLPVLPYGG